MCRIKPIDKQAIKFAAAFKKIFFFEEGMLTGGIGETFENELINLNYSEFYKITAIDDCFVPHSTTIMALENYKLDPDSMCKIISETCEVKNEKTT